MNNLNMKYVLKRVLAYMIDIVIITILATLITNIPYFNKNYQQYQEKYKDYQEIYQNYINLKNILNDMYQDKQINEEEYSKFIENEICTDIIVKYYEDEKITNEEYNNLIEKIDENYTIQAKEYNYQLQKLGIYNSVITLIVTLLYFGIFQYFYKGKTVGKKLFHLKIVSINNKKITILKYILRSLIINNILLNAINLIILIYISKNNYERITNIISILVSLLEAITLYLVILRKDHRGLHDLIFKTKVITTNN